MKWDVRNGRVSLIGDPQTPLSQVEKFKSPARDAEALSLAIAQRRIRAFCSHLIFARQEGRCLWLRGRGFARYLSV